jgi:hypothetical protein
MSKTKQELLDEARAAGVTDVSEDTTNEDIEARIRSARRNSQATNSQGPVAGDEARERAGVATVADNEALAHTDEDAPRTTRHDRTDLGVPMLQGSPDEPQGPEDAFGPGDKRGDYSKRTGGVNSTQAVAVEHDDPFVRDDEGNVIDRKPTTELVHQTPLASQQGEVEGEKGGVTTA